MTDLKSILKGKVVMLCVGNRERGDDGVGPFFADAIKGKVSYEVIDAGVSPENYTGVITKLNPDTIIIIDGIYFEGKPGQMRLFSGDELRSGKISTHDVSLKLLIEYLKSSIKADIYVVGIRPESNKYGNGLSEPVEKAVKKLEALFLTR
jgi:hydrogenase 3 maturation protease